jgi:hypothetical protein
MRVRTGVLACSLCFVALTGWFGQVDAAVCKYVDRAGRVTYSNLDLGPRGGTKVECFPTPAPVSAAPSAPATAVGEQTTDDAEGRSALEQQLADEEERLEEAQRALSEQEANLSADGAPYYYDWLSPYVNAVTAHRRNRDRIRHQLAEHGQGRGPSHSALSGVPATRPPPSVPGGEDSMHGRPDSGSSAGQPEHHPAAGLGQQRGGWTGSRPEAEFGRQ